MFGGGWRVSLTSRKIADETHLILCATCMASRPLMGPPGVRMVGLVGQCLKPRSSEKVGSQRARGEHLSLVLKGSGR